MKTYQHAIIGAVVAAAPDLVLLTFGWRKQWLPEAHSLVRAHRFLHSPWSLLLIIPLAWMSHVIVDQHSTHRTRP